MNGSRSLPNSFGDSVRTMTAPPIFLLALRLEGQQRRLAIAGVLLLSVGVTLGLLVWAL